MQRPDPDRRAAGLRRRALLWAVVLPAVRLLSACAEAPVSSATDADAGQALLRRVRTVSGGFLSPPGPVYGVPARPGTGMYVKLAAPTAIALQGSDLLVVDSALGRLWRVDIGLNTLSGIAGAPALPGTAVALGADLSAWVLDAASHQVLRFARDGRLLQTFRAGIAAPAPVGLALADGGATLLLADSVLGQWAELRSAGGFARPVRPVTPAGGGIAVDGIAIASETVFVLDRRAGLVHRVRRDGLLVDSLGAGELKQPVALVADRLGRVFVHDAQDRAVKLLRPGRPAQVFDAVALGVQQIGAIAVDERFLAVADRLSGQVVVYEQRGEAAR